MNWLPLITFVSVFVLCLSVGFVIHCVVPWLLKGPETPSHAELIEDCKRQLEQMAKHRKAIREAELEEVKRNDQRLDELEREVNRLKQERCNCVKCLEHRAAKHALRVAASGMIMEDK